MGARRGALAGGLVIVALACGPRGRDGELVVAAAASLRDVLTASAPAFEARHPGARLVFSFAGSSTLARQIEAGADFDLFLSADPALVERLSARLAPGPATAFLANRLALVESAGRASGVTDPRGLVDAPGPIAVAAPAVPAGHYARLYLEQEGLLARLAPRLVDADHVRATLALAESGAADFAFVYATDARVAPTAHLLWTAPAGVGPPVRYVAARLARSRVPQAAAYLAFLSDDAFRREACSLGFESE